MKRIIFTLSIVFAILLFLIAMYHIFPVLIIAIIISYVIKPIAKYKFFHNRHTIFVLTAIFGIISLFTILAITVIPLCVQQLSYFFYGLPKYFAYIQENIVPFIVHKLGSIDQHIGQKITAHLDNQMDFFIDKASNIASNIVEYGVTMFSFLYSGLFLPFLLFYILMDDGRTSKTLLSIIPQAHQHNIKEICLQVDNVLSAYLKGQFLVCLIQSAFYGITLFLLGINNGLIIGIITGFLILVPYAGAFIALLFTLLSSYISGDSFIIMLSVVLVFIVGQTIESNLLTPRILGNRVGLSSLWVITSLVIGGNLFGLVGIILAIPVVSSLKVIAKYLINIYKESELYYGGN